MAIPDYQTLMAPVLRALADGQRRTAKQVREFVAAEVGVTADEQLELVPSGTPVFLGRVNWALTYMAQAGLVARPKRGQNQITERGMQVLAKHPDRVDNRVLQTFAEFRDFKSRGRERVKALTVESAELVSSVSAGTPRETITAAVEEINADVADRILERVREREPAFLERLVLRVLTAMGYAGAAGSAQQLGRSGDEGLDGVIKQDALGLDRIYVQAKRYAAHLTVGRPDIQGFVGALHGAQADRGVFITTSRFSVDAYSYADKVAARVILIDGSTLAGLLVKHNIGAQDDESFTLKKLDEDFFDDA